MDSCSRASAFVRHGLRFQRGLAVALLASAMAPALASRLDIVGPQGSGRFGYQVLALPNGNVAISDPVNADFTLRPGAVYLYRPDGSLISVLYGTDSKDGVGSQLRALPNGNFVVISPNWHVNRGAVTFVNGTTGLSGEVSAANSLVGTQVNDSVGYSYVDSWFEPPPPPQNFAVVGTSNYVVISNHWNDGNNWNVGAVTWCSGTAGCTGPVTRDNSLIGGSAGDFIGTHGFHLLSNGNYLVVSGDWDNPGVAGNAGAVTLGNGSGGTTGVITSANSLVGSKAGDISWVDVAALSNGNYVLGIPYWDNGAIVDAGAAVWGNGTSGVAGTISPANAMIGTHTEDYVGERVTALSNGHYVVCNYFQDSDSLENAGAAIWGNGETGTTGIASALPSLTGTESTKGPAYAVALTNGNYVVVSPNWGANFGAVTWVNGSAATSGTVTAANSLVGSTAEDHVGTSVVALTNGNYVVGSPDWDGVAQDTGAATWANGATGIVGAVSAANSLVGSTAGDGRDGFVITPLSNGHYVVNSAGWNNGSATYAGAVTWANGTTGLVGPVSALNSLVGTSGNDAIGSAGVTALSNGNYVVGSSGVGLDGHLRNGAATWGNGATGTVGTVSISNSLYGSTNDAHFGSGGVTATHDGNYVIRTNARYIGPGVYAPGAVTLGSGTLPVAGPISAANSVIQATNYWMTTDYDAVNHRLVIGQTDSNIVTVFALDADELFASGFE